MNRNLLNILLFLLVTSSGSLFAQQTLYNVNVSNFEFDPETLTIQVGDTVRWINSGGNHSVQGDLDTYPENPEGFGNEASSDNWQYDFEFNIEGDYDYRCGIHTGSMFGHIIVEGTVGITEEESGPLFALFPNPINNQLRWKWNDNSKPTQAFFSLFDAKGKLVKQLNLLTSAEADMSELSEGLYIYSVDMKNQGTQTGKILISR